MSKLGEISEFDETLFEREIDGEEIPVVELKDDGYDSSIFEEPVEEDFLDEVEIIDAPELNGFDDSIFEEEENINYELESYIDDISDTDSETPEFIHEDVLVEDTKSNDSIKDYEDMVSLEVVENIYDNSTDKQLTSKTRGKKLNKDDSKKPIKVKAKKVKKDDLKYLIYEVKALRKAVESLKKDIKNSKQKKDEIASIDRILAEYEAKEGKKVK